MGRYYARHLSCTDETIMTLVAGYLPVWMSSNQHDEYIDHLSKHYNADYFDFEELEFIDHVVPQYMHITANKSGRHVCTYFRKTVRTWEWYAKRDDFHHTLSLMKLS